MTALPPLAEIYEDYEMLDGEDRYRLMIDLGRMLEAMPDALKTDATLVAAARRRCGSIQPGCPRAAALPRRQQCRDHQGIVAGVERGPGPAATEVAKADIAAELARRPVAAMSSNRTQGIPNMISLVRRTAERMTL